MRFRTGVFIFVIVSLTLAACQAEKSARAVTDTPTACGSPEVLFIGNSYTFHNDMPEMFAEFVHASGGRADVKMSASGGWTLSDHAASEKTAALIDSQDWDYVVLQEQSVIPSVQAEREQHMYPAARALDEKIQARGAETILLMTWGRRDGLPSEGYPDFEAMQVQLAAGYMEIAEQLGAIAAPVGIAWQNAIAHDPQLDLWAADGSHPNRSGSYLTASVLYVVICQQSPEGLAYRAGLPDKTGQFLQSIAATSVLQARTTP